MPESPSKQLAEFLAAQPSWILKVLHHDYDSLSSDEQEAYASNFLNIERVVRPKYVKIIRQIDTAWNKYCRAQKQLFSDVARAGLPKGKSGRPRKDALAEKALELHNRGMSHAEVAKQLQTSREAVRKMLSSRKPLPPPEKT